MRERELKLRTFRGTAAWRQSLPMRERELKHWLLALMRKIDNVAPHAGARIETLAVD